MLEGRVQVEPAEAALSARIFHPVTGLLKDCHHGFREIGTVGMPIVTGFFEAFREWGRISASERMVSLALSRGIDAD